MFCYFEARLHFATFSLTTFAFIVLTVTGCQQQKTNPLEKITIAYTINLNSVLVHIDFMQDFFKEEGLGAVPQHNIFGKVALHHLPFLVFHNLYPLLITP